MELKHYGVLGMHWGIRRYQPYPKGQKPAGAKEIGEAAESSNDSQGVQQRTQQRSSSNIGYGYFPDARSLSDEEMSSIVRRLTLEKQYKQLTEPQKSKSRKFVEDVLLNSLKSVATTYTTKALTAGIDSAIQKMAKDSSPPNPAPKDNPPKDKKEDKKK